jgi:protein-tyrosine-phosphatase
MAKINNVLFICSGNTCRSPFAEYYAKWLKKTKYKDKLNGVNFDSAGLYHYYEQPQEGTVKFLRSKGISIDDFQAKEVDEDLLDNHDLILGFEKKWHINKLKRKFKNSKELGTKLHLLRKFAGFSKDLDIPDPFHLKEKEYNAVLKKIEIAVEKVVEKIIEINNE